MSFIKTVLLLSFSLFAAGYMPNAAHALDDGEQTYTEAEVLSVAENFFGDTAENLAEAIHWVFAENGEPNAYIVGKETAGAFFFGLRVGSGDLVLKDAGTHPIYWQGPSLGWDVGGDAARVFTLVYDLPDRQSMYQRFPGVEGSAYFIGGIGINYQRRGDITLVPMRAGLGLRLGANAGYLSYTQERDWLPF